MLKDFFIASLGLLILLEIYLGWKFSKYLISMRFIYNAYECNIQAIVTELRVQQRANRTSNLQSLDSRLELS